MTGGRTEGNLSFDRVLEYRPKSLVEAALCIVLLILCLFAIGVAARTIYLVGDTAPLITIDPLPRSLSSRLINLTGQTRPSANVEIFQGDRVFGLATSRTDGHFSALLMLQYPVPELSVGLRAPGGKLENSTSVKLPPWQTGTFKPNVAIAYQIADDRLWISGYGSPTSQFIVQDQNTKPISEVTSNAYGFFDAILEVPQSRRIAAVSVKEISSPQEPSAARQRGALPEPSATPQVVTPSLPEPSVTPQFDASLLPDHVMVSEPAKVENIDWSTFPVARATEIQMPEFAFDKAKVSMKLSLPAAYPPLQMFVEGFLPFEEFLRAVLGFHDFFVPRPSFTLLDRNEWTHITFDFDTYLNTDSLLGGSLVGRLQSEPMGLGSQPLLSDKDSIVVRLANGSPNWFGQPTPDEFTGDLVRWTGPHLRSRDKEFNLGLGRAITSDRPLAAPKPGETIATVLWRLETRGGNVLANIWRTIIIAIPFVGVIWIATRAPLQVSPCSWQTLAAMATLLLGLRSTLTLHSLVVFQGGSRLLQLVKPFFSALLPSTRLQTGVNLLPLDAELEDAFWITFLVVLALALAWFRSIRNGIMPSRSSKPKSLFGLLSRWRKWLRLVYCGLLAGVAVSIALNVAEVDNVQHAFLTDTLHTLTELLGQGQWAGDVEHFGLIHLEIVRSMLLLTALTIAVVPLGIRPMAFMFSLWLVSLWSFAIELTSLPANPFSWNSYIVSTEGILRLQWAVAAVLGSAGVLFVVWLLRTLSTAVEAVAPDGFWPSRRSVLNLYCHASPHGLPLLLQQVELSFPSHGLDYLVSKPCFIVVGRPHSSDFTAPGLFC